ncbi:MAG: hypothetical protein E6J41_32890 [Chloroflexi bacterium]|nr:MAG: hypothetical protein E6J41_32890 [Chloroflexota bacterium]
MAVAAIPVHLFTGGNQVPDVDPNEWLLSAGIRSAKFDKVGDEVVGYIARQPEVQQQRDFETSELKVWSDGNPMMQLRVVLQTDQRDPEDAEDSGERAVYIRGNMQRAVAQAVRAASAPGLEVGGKLLVKYVADGKAARRGFNPPKVYEAKYRAPEREATAVPDAVRETVPASAASGNVNHKSEVPF